MRRDPTAAVARAGGGRGRSSSLNLAVFGVYGAIAGLYWVPSVLLSAAINVDGLIYWRAAGEMLRGGDPYDVAVLGLHPAAPPATILALAPFTVLPESVFTIVWLLISAAAAVAIVRRLGLPWRDVAYPPLVLGVLIGSPMVVGMALFVHGWRWLGLVLRPQLVGPAVGERRWRSLLAATALIAASLLIVPSYISDLPAISARYSAESGPPINAWGSLFLVPVGVSIVALATIDLRSAGWLAVPALFPAVGYSTSVMTMITGSPALMVGTAIPVPGSAAVAISAFCWIRVYRELRRRRDGRDAGGSDREDQRPAGGRLETWARAARQRLEVARANRS